MAITADSLREKLIETLNAEHVDIQDISPDLCGTSFSAVVVSPQFQGKPRLQQQRMVNAAIADELKQIHAFTMKTFNPEAWKKKNAG